MSRHSSNKDKLLAALSKEATFMLRGSLVKLKGKCGKPNCGCAQDPSRRHTRYYLSYSEKGKTRMVYVSRGRVEQVSEAVDAWKRFKELGEEIALKNLKEFKKGKKR